MLQTLRRPIDRLAAHFRRRAEAGEGIATLDLIFMLIGAGLFIAAVLTAVPKMFLYLNRTKTEQQISELSSNIINRYASSGSYTGLTTATAVTNNLFPGGMVAADGSTVTHAFHGNVAVGTTTINNATLATVTFNAVPPDMCLDLINAGGAVYVYTSAQSTPTAPPFTVSSAVTDTAMCPSAETTGIDITWVYR